MLDYSQWVLDIRTGAYLTRASIPVICAQNRPKGGINEEKEFFAQSQAPIDDLKDVVKTVKPTAMIGG